jgi:hypothetical protein
MRVEEHAPEELAPTRVPDTGEVERRSVSEVAEEVGRATATLAFRRAQLALAEQAPEVQRTTRALAAAGICAVALLTAFVFGNWAVASALSSPLPGWRAPVVLAAVWLAIGVLVAAMLLRSERAAWKWLRGLGADEGETMRLRQEALDEAEQTLRRSLDRLSDAIALAAEERIAGAILPVAGGMVDVGEDMVEATDDVLEAADEITDVVEEAVPGGVVVNRAVDLALAPGRLGVRVARSVFTLGRNETEEG